MTIILKDVPAELESELRARAELSGQSVEEVALSALNAGLHVSGLDPALRAVIGQWIDDADFDAAVASFEQVDEGMWQ